jgi:hypothetical protein
MHHMYILEEEGMTDEPDTSKEKAVDTHDTHQGPAYGDVLPERGSSVHTHRKRMRASSSGEEDLDTAHIDFRAPLPSRVLQRDVEGDFFERIFSWRVRR